MRLRDDKTNKEIIIRNKNRAQGAQQSKREVKLLLEAKILALEQEINLPHGRGDNTKREAKLLLRRKNPKSFAHTDVRSKAKENL